MKRLVFGVLALGLTACSSGPGAAERLASQGGANRCIAMVDALNTLQVGDPLPRVREVLGTPSRMYRARTSLGRSDVLEYNIGPSLCAKQLFGSGSRGVVRVMFDRDGRFVAYNGRGTLRVAQASWGRPVPLPYDRLAAGTP